jgi:general secretion pathway protein G
VGQPTCVDNIPRTLGCPRRKARNFKAFDAYLQVFYRIANGLMTPMTGVRSSFFPARGFTLIEIMVVITILGVLAALIVPRVVGRTDDARIAAAKQDIASIMQALKLYRLDNGRYPTTDQGLQALITRPTTEPMPSNWKQGGYLERLAADPWGEPYKFLNPGVRGEIDVFSLGRDRANGGEPNTPDADIGSWQL